MTDVTRPTDQLDDLSDDAVLENLDDFEREPVLKRPGRVLTPLTWGLVALVLAVGTFALGAKLGNDHGKNTASASATGGLSQLLAARGLGTGAGAATRTGGTAAAVAVAGAGAVARSER